jgi:predicted nucleic acid-binding protein
VADVYEALRRFVPVGKARAGSASAGHVVERLLVDDRWARSFAVASKM